MADIREGELKSRLTALIQVAEQVRSDYPNDTLRRVLQADFLVTKQLYFQWTGETWKSKMAQTQRWLEHG